MKHVYGIKSVDCCFMKVKLLLCFRANIGEVFERLVGELNGDDSLWLCTSSGCFATIISLWAT